MLSRLRLERVVVACLCPSTVGRRLEDAEFEASSLTTRLCLNQPNTKRKKEKRGKFVAGKREGREAGLEAEAGDSGGGGGVCK